MVAALEALRQSGKLHKAKIVGYKGGRKLVCCCPYHHESTPSFAIFENGGFHCMGCGVSGVVSRHDGSHDDLLNHLNLDRPAVPLRIGIKASTSTALEPDLLDRAYRAALSLINLRHQEREHLTQRGLTQEHIAAWETRGYRSAPTSWTLRTAIADAAIAAVGKEAAQSLPFLQPSKKAPGGLICSDVPGLLVPIHDTNNRIVACKVRLIDQEKSRFLWWKARHSTATTGAPIHIFGSKTATLAIVVEGPIKADLVGTLWPRIFGESVTVLAIPGATAHAGLSASLEQLGLRRVLLALDPDKAGRKTTEELQPRLHKAGFAVETAHWPEGFGKIDDFLAHPSAPHAQLNRLPYQPEPPQPVTKPFETMEEARTAARPWLEAALTAPRGTVHHMALEMGGGKTHLAVELVNELYDAGKLKGQIGLFTPRHEQGEQFTGTSGWARHYGATYGFVNGEPTPKSPCREPRRMLTVVNAGAPTKLACETCPQRDDCANNFSRDPALPFLLTQKTTTKDRHLYNANSLRDPSVVARLSTIILDDLDLEKVMVDQTFLDTDQLRKAILWAQRDLEYAPLLPLLEGLWAVLPTIAPKRFPHDAPRLNGEALQDALAAKAGGLEVLGSDLEMALQAKDPHPLSPLGEVRSDIPHRGFLKLAQRLSEELAQRGQPTWNPMVHLKPDGISFWTRAKVDFTGKTLILLNAGNSAQQYQRLFPNAQVQVFHGRVTMPNRTKVAQIPVGPYTLKGSSKLVEQIARALQARKAHHPHESPADWGLVAGGTVREEIENLFPGINARHYGNQTGSNEMESVRFLIVAGDFKPNPHGFFEEAQAIWGDSPLLQNNSQITYTKIQDRSGKSINRGRRGYLDHRLDARWLELTAGEVRQAVGRGRPWNTGNDKPEQGKLFRNSSPHIRRLDVLILSSYALEAIVADQLTGQRADLEDVLTAAAVELRRAGQLVTLTALRTKTGISDRQIRERFNRVKLRSEAEILTLRAALSSSPGFSTVLQNIELLPTPSDPHGNPQQRRGPPVHGLVQPVHEAVQRSVHPPVQAVHVN